MSAYEPCSYFSYANFLKPFSDLTTSHSMGMTGCLKRSESANTSQLETTFIYNLKCSPYEAMPLKHIHRFR